MTEDEFLRMEANALAQHWIVSPSFFPTLEGLIESSKDGAELVKEVHRLRADNECLRNRVIDLESQLRS